MTALEHQSLVPVDVDRARAPAIQPGEFDVPGSVTARPPGPSMDDRFRLAFEQAPIGACMIGLDLRYLCINRRLCQMLGYDAVDLIDRGVAKFTHPDDVAAELHAMRQMIDAGDEVIVLEKRFLRSDGAVVFAKLHKWLVRDAVGQPQHYLAFAEDITAQKRHMEFLAHRERMQEAVAVCSQRLIGNTSTALEELQALTEAVTVLRQSAGMLRVTLFENFTHPVSGFSSRPVAGAWAPGEQSLLEIFGEDYHLPWLATSANREILAAGEHIGGPVEQLFKDKPAIIAIERRLGIGSVQLFSIFVSGRWWGYLAFDDRAVREWDEQEVLLIRTVAGIIGSFLQRNRDVAALREREAMLRALGDNLPDAQIYQLEGAVASSPRLTYLSRGLERRTGISVEQAFADPDHRLAYVHDDDLPSVSAADRAARINATPYDQEFRYYAADGSIRWMRARSTPRRLADGRVLRDGIAFDTTVRRQLQESLRQANLGLTQRVEELSLLNRIAQTLSSVANLSETLDMVCRLLRATFQAVEVLIALRDRPSAALQIVAYQAEDGNERDMLARNLDEGTSIALVLREGRVIIEESPATDGAATLIAPLRSQSEVIGLLRIRRLAPRPGFSPDNVSLVQTIAGAIVAAVVNANLYARAVRGSTRLERLNAASRTISEAGLDLSVVYAAIHHAVAQLMQVEAFTISLVEPDSQIVELVYCHDYRTGFCGPGRALLNRSFAGFMRRHGPALRVDDFERFYADHPEVHFEVFGDMEDTRSGVAASFITADGLYGLLFAQCYPPGAYTDDDVTILELLAAHAATAIENARRAQQNQRDAIDEERNRLARDLHDSVSQSLFSASLIAERLPAAANISAAEAQQGLEMLRQLVRGALVEMRALLVELRPAALAAAPLHEALDQLTRAFSGRRGMPISVALSPAPALPENVQIALYRIAQECLSNSIKHAQARLIHVDMAVEPPVAAAGAAWSGTVTLTVRDDGRGFDIGQIDPARFGLGIMRERAAAVGAELAISSQIGQGASITVMWRGVAIEEER